MIAGVYARCIGLLYRAVRRGGRRAAVWLPPPAGARLAGLLGLAWAALSPAGWKQTRLFGADYGFGPLAGLLMAGRGRAALFRTSALLLRLQHGGLSLADVPIAHRNYEAVAALIRQERPFLVVFGHFGIITSTIAVLRLPVAAMAATAWDPAGVYELIDTLRGQRAQACPPGLPEKVPTYLCLPMRGDQPAPAVAAMLCRYLRTRGNVVLVAGDVGTAKPLYTRPFAGYAHFPCAPYVARLARLAQCPVVILAATMGRNGEILAHWSNPLPPSPPDDRQAEIALTNAVLDRLEQAIGRHLEQYSMPAGQDRVWNRRRRRWQDRADGAMSQEA